MHGCDPLEMRRRLAEIIERGHFKTLTPARRIPRRSDYKSDKVVPFVTNIASLTPATSSLKP